MKFPPGFWLPGRIIAHKWSLLFCDNPILSCIQWNYFSEPFITFLTRQCKHRLYIVESTAKLKVLLNHYLSMKIHNIFLSPHFLESERLHIKWHLPKFTSCTLETIGEKYLICLIMSTIISTRATSHETAMQKSLIHRRYPQFCKQLLLNASSLPQLLSNDSWVSTKIVVFHWSINSQP